MAFKVTYNGNGSTSGTPPVDNNAYNLNDTVNVLEPFLPRDGITMVPPNTVAGSLARAGAEFAYWSSQPDGSGTPFFWPGGVGSFQITSDITIYAQWFIKDGLHNGGLSNGGINPHYAFAYDAELKKTAANPGGLEPDRTNQLIDACEGDYQIMSGWFGETYTLDNLVTVPISVNVANRSGGADASAIVVLRPDSDGDAQALRCLLVAEVTEYFMHAQNKGWGFVGNAGNEESSGEALSLFLELQFALLQGFPKAYFLTTTGAADNWLNSSLPTSDSHSTRFYDGSTADDYGSRADYVNSILPKAGNGPATGCSLLFIYYLFHQLGFSIQQIIAAAPGYTNGILNTTGTLRGVYQNLTGDAGDPFPFFKQLLDNVFPPDQQASIPGPNQDDPFPLAMLSFLVDKSTFGRDEVLDVINSVDAGRFYSAFWLVLEGFNKNTFLSLAPTLSAFTGSFTGITGMTIIPNPTFVEYEDYDDAQIPQRIRLCFDIIFTMASLSDFPAPGSSATQYELDTSVTAGGNVISGSAASTLFELVSGADPYFTNVNRGLGNYYWLSQDLRVFTVTPGLNTSPFGNIVPLPALNPVDTFTLDPGAGFLYAQDLVGYLNNNYSHPIGVDPFMILPGQGMEFSDASSVARYHYDFSDPLNPRIYQNYNFAVARVRLTSAPATATNAQNVKVFFRLWQTQTADTDFGIADYPSTLDAAGFPETPLPGAGNHTVPFFASGNFSSNNDYTGTDLNNRNISASPNSAVWTYFVCYLNLYDNSNSQSVSNDWAVGTHHCLVAEIAYDGAPILTSGIAKNPENCDKLAQRNLQLTFSDNPGEPATHRVPQTFDIRPGKSFPIVAGSPINDPDELMIDWGGVPVNSIANIYWPQVNAADVISLANSRYGTHFLSALDNHTIQCKVNKGISYIPVPTGSGQNFAGLFSVDLPPTVVAGQQFNILVRKISTHGSLAPNRGVNQPNAKAVSQLLLRSGGTYKNWRYITGAFQVRIPVTTKATMLFPEENTLAVMKARLQAMSPANRWYQILQRYISYISARIDGLGGDSSAIRPSFQGIIPIKPAQGANVRSVSKDSCCRQVIWVLCAMCLLLFLLILILLLKR